MEEGEREARELLGPVMADEEIVGRFHVDFLSEESDADWGKVVKGSKNSPGILCGAGE